MPDFSIILHPTDLSACSMSAFRVARSLARDATRLIVVHVMEESLVASEGYLASLNEQLRQLEGPDRGATLEFHIKDGHAGAEILRMADDVGADLIVMGTHGRKGLRRLLAGSVAAAVVRGAHCPVLTLRTQATPPAAEEIRLILHPTDFSESCESALWVSRSLARDHDARLVILHVASVGVHSDGTISEKVDPRYFRDALKNLRKRLGDPGWKYLVETRLSRGLVHEEILRTAEELGCDLIVIGTHGRTGLDRLLMGNVAESVLHQADCQVMVVRAGQPVPSMTSDQSASRYT